MQTLLKPGTFRRFLTLVSVVATLLVASCLYLDPLATADDAATTRIEIADRDHVIDGWVRTNSATSFTDEQLAAHGRAWSA